MSNDKVREEFEYAENQRLGDPNLSRHGDGYVSPVVQYDWIIWQAATAATQRDAMAVAEAIMDAASRHFHGGESAPDLAAIIAALPAGQSVSAQQQGEPVADKFFAYDENVGFDLFDTADEAKKYAQESIDEYRAEAGDGWADEVEHVCWGIVLVTTQEIDLGEPEPEYDGGQGIAGLDRYVDYILTDTTPPVPAGSVPDVESIARTIWNIRREEEDRCDMELEDMPRGDSVWREAEAVFDMIYAQKGTEA